MSRCRRIAAWAVALLVLGLQACVQYPDGVYGQPVGQPTYGSPPPVYGGGSGDTITCESRDGGFQECGTPFRGPPVIAATLSSAACIEGRTWGSRGQGSVWVNGGCRARFVDSYGYGGGGGYGNQQVLRCESQDGYERVCQSPLRGRMMLQRQLSSAACIEGQTWGSDHNGRVWVRGGCRGEFVPAQGWSTQPSSGATFRCESDDGRHRECRALTSGRQVLVRQLSSASCIEGQSWGSRDGTVWVRNGCRAEFGPIAGGHSGGGYSGGAYQITCSSEQQRRNQCAWDTRRGYPRLLEQLSSDPCREGQSWGYDGRGGLWVDRGCRGRFGVR